MGLNYYAINQVIGATMTPVARQRFGHFNRLGVVAEVLRHRPAREKAVPFSYEWDRVLVQAFEEVRAGAAPDRILWDDKLAASFETRARKLGVHAPSAQLRRRLINIRKNKTRYQKHGIVLSETTVVEPHASIVPKYAHVIEFALVKLRNRYGVSIDDILLDPKLILEYEKLASDTAKDLSSMDLRLGALYIRKTRHVPKQSSDLFKGLEVEAIQREFQEVGTVRTASATDAPASSGLIEVVEKSRVLYVAKNDNLREVVGQIVSGGILNLLSNHFWTPRPDQIGIRILPGKSFEHISLERWQLKLIQEKKPLFNWPVAA